MFRTLPPELQDIVWDFCGDLRNADTRHKRFTMIELRTWTMLFGTRTRDSRRDRNLCPSRLLRYRDGLLKRYLHLVYRKAHLETAYKGPLKLEQLSTRMASLTNAQVLGSW
jgi:hypothetical protein